ncbi:thiol:disulfide interchange protein DsbC [Atlantibacter hermannii]|nr:thiol:disulfide interchange protein DsbC [Atlantibacter hermannii]
MTVNILSRAPLYDVSGNQPVNVTNQLLMGKLNQLEKEMIVYKAPQEKARHYSLYRHYLRLLPQTAMKR